MYFEFDSADEALAVLAKRIVDTGHKTAPHDKPTKELLGVSFTLRDPRCRLILNDARKVRHHYSAACVAWNLSQRHDVASISFWNERGREFSDDDQTFHGSNYGERWSETLWQAAALIKLRDLETRRAWVAIYNPDDDSGSYSMYGKDVPCAIGFALTVVNNKLVMQTVMRSQSVVGVLPYDLFLFTSMQELLANELDLELGYYTHMMLSAHVYEPEFTTAEKIWQWWSDAQPHESKPMEQLSYTVLSATERWTKSMDTLMSGGAIDDPDEYERLMAAYVKKT